MHCLWCDAAIIPDISWRTIIWLDKPSCLCSSCEAELVLLRGKSCSKCGRLSDADICPDCEWWIRQADHDPLISNHAVYTYNDAMQEMVSKWKYRGDYCLGKAFASDYHNAFKQAFAFLPKETKAVPIPLSEERMRERGFNQSKMLAGFLPLETHDVLRRKHSEKQSKRTRRQRITAVNPFYMTGTINNPVIIADDIYTTGTTLRHAAFVLKEHGCPAVYALTLIRG